MVAGQGFTLVELLVVIIIIAVLLIIAIPRYFQAVYTAEVRGCQAQINIISTAAPAFFARNHRWPATVEEMCEQTAPPGVVGPPLTEIPQCPFGVPYELRPVLEDGTVGPPSADNPQAGVAVNTEDHFEGSWVTATRHREP
jgi:prepilin-type N-terminal cleavage/methylation domain-containing protein